jgi:hypothetical protein
MCLFRAEYAHRSVAAPHDVFLSPFSWPFYGSWFYGIMNELFSNPVSLIELEILAG